MLESYITPYHATSAISGDRIAILAPHPDDEVFGCGGAACKWSQQGNVVQAFVLTSGVLRHEFPEGPCSQQKRDEKEALRRQESRAAAVLLGLNEPEFLSAQDGELWQDTHIEADLLCQLEAFQPTTLVMPSIWEMHRDHRATAELGLRLAEQLSSLQQVSFYEIGVPLMPNVLEDISVQQGLKWQAMQCFESQLIEQNYATQIAGLNQYRAYTLGKTITHAEAYYCLSVADIEAFQACHAPTQISLALRHAELQQQKLEEKFQQRIAHLETQIQQVEISASWRITSPLRWIKQTLSKFCRS